MITPFKPPAHTSQTRRQFQTQIPPALNYGLVMILVDDQNSRKLVRERSGLFLVVSHPIIDRVTQLGGAEPTPS